MSHRNNLQFHCQGCEGILIISLLEREDFNGVVCCENCGKKYAFEEGILEQLRQFEALCRQIHASKEILGNSSIAIDVGNHHVKVPFNILLTRLSSVIELNMGGKNVTIAFRVEPLKDVEQLALKSIKF